MEARAQIHIENSDVYLYTLGNSKLKRKRAAIAKKMGDVDYIIEVNCKLNTITTERDDGSPWVGSFEEFIEDH